MLNKHNLNLAALTSKDVSRFTLNGILVTPTETVETDGHQLCMVTMQKTDTEAVPHPEGVDFAPAAEWKPFILPSSEALDIAKAIPKKSTVPICQNAFIGAKTDVNGTAQIAVTNLEQFRVFNPRKLEGSFPDYGRVIPKPEAVEKPPALCVTIDAALLARVLKQVASFRDGERQPFCRMYFWGKPVATRAPLDGEESAPLTVICNGAIRIDADNDTGQHFTGVVMPACKGDYTEARLDETGKRIEAEPETPAETTEVAPEPAESEAPAYYPIYQDAEYAGERWRYGLRNRPVMIGAVPKGYLVGSERNEPNPATGGQYRFGTIDYPRRLAENDLYNYELAEVCYWAAGEYPTTYLQKRAVEAAWPEPAPVQPAPAPEAPKPEAPKPAAGALHCPKCNAGSANRQGVVAHLRIVHKITDKSERDSLMAGM